MSVVACFGGPPEPADAPPPADVDLEQSELNIFAPETDSSDPLSLPEPEFTELDPPTGSAAIEEPPDTFDEAGTVG